MIWRPLDENGLMSRGAATSALLSEMPLVGLAGWFGGRALSSGEEPEQSEMEGA